MNYVPANAGVKAYVMMPGATKATLVDVVAWGIVGEGPTPPQPIVAPVPPGVRIAVPVGGGPQVFEWPRTVRASVEAFEENVA